MNSWNLDKLDRVSLSIIAYMFEHVIVGWTYCYMVEVRLDKPGRWLLDGGKDENGESVLSTHGGNGSRGYARHYDDPGWAVVHCDDEDWLALGQEKLLEEGYAYIEILGEHCNG